MTQIEHEPATPEELRPSPPHSASPYRAAAIALAAALLLVVALVATAPFWALALPWARPAAPQPDSRIEQLAAALQQEGQQRRQVEAALQRLDQRMATAAAAKAVPSASESPGLRQEVVKLSGAVEDLQKRVEAFAYKHERLAADVGDLAQALRDTGQRAAASATDTALALVLLQIRDAAAIGRPFAAEYAALAALAHDRPEIAAAAAPLAEPAKSGVASRAVLAKGLRELSRTIASAPVPVSAPAGWGAAALARLRGLVTIRRIDGAMAGGPQGEVAAAGQALAGGDLAGAIAALDAPTGAPKEAAGAWLRMARERLAVDTALARVEALLTTRLSETAPPSAPPH